MLFQSAFSSRSQSAPPGFEHSEDRCRAEEVLSRVLCHDSCKDAPSPSTSKRRHIRRPKTTVHSTTMSHWPLQQSAVQWAEAWGAIERESQARLKGSGSGGGGVGLGHRRGGFFSTVQQASKRAPTKLEPINGDGGSTGAGGGTSSTSSASSAVLEPGRVRARRRQNE
mmetsp:Transcript_17048/g.40175  ORF Transcript_17048/g.40175 Transcript_17048/m.40175 type:complete len:168 (-) Transcript_17048:269-772(-)